MLLTVVRVLLALALYAVAIVVIGLALCPAIMLIRAAWTMTGYLGFWPQTLWVSLAVGAGYFLFGSCLMLLSALMRSVFRLDLKEGEYPLASLSTLRWYISNALQFLVWTIFGDFLLMTPFAALFYQLMGAKLGLNVQIN